jgi:CDGSH-type Zn-finger protein
MSEPIVAKKGSYLLELDPGEYWWCTCGHAKTQPFCDGSHTGTGLEPMSFTVTERQKVDLCGCKHSKTKPFCDGTHRQLT